MVRSKAWLVLAAAIGWMWGVPAAADDDAGKILRPADNSSYESGQVDVVATAPSGKLQLDGIVIQTEQPFPDVFHATLKSSPGMHLWFCCGKAEKRKCIFLWVRILRRAFSRFTSIRRFRVCSVPNATGLNRRGRFVFKGGCFDCHQRDGFAKIHTHEPAVLEQCGMCHNAHGSTVKAHLIVLKGNRLQDLS